MRFRGMWRWIDIALNVLCVVLVLGLAGLYIRQQSHIDTLTFFDSNSLSHVESTYGQIVFSTEGRMDFVDVSIIWSAIKVDDLQGTMYANVTSWWFRWDTSGPSYRLLSVPMWFLILLFSIKPTWSFVAWKRKCRRTRNDDDHPLCANCGYDLYGVTSGKCPECGALF